MPKIHRGWSRGFWPLGVANFQTSSDFEVGSFYAESAQAAVRHAAHHGQRGDIFLASHTVYFYIQVSCDLSTKETNNITRHRNALDCETQHDFFIGSPVHFSKSVGTLLAGVGVANDCVQIFLFFVCLLKIGV